MKIDRKRPSHWLYLVLAGVHALLARVLRKLLRPGVGSRPLILLYGHKLNGNLLALYRQLRNGVPMVWRPVFLTLDPAYYKHLRAQGVDCALVTRPSSVNLLVHAAAMVTDHGLHSLQVLLGKSGLRFFDVWHGIPFKGFNADDFRIQHRYDEVWVASPSLRRMYIEKFGFNPARVVATGYGRTDALVRRDVSMETHVRHCLGVETFQRCVLFAPTWRQDDSSREIYPFGQSEDVFLGALAAVCERHDAALLVRKHLNSGGGGRQIHSNVRLVPSTEFPDTESIVAISDVLILDWSSIAFDFLLLDRPTIFLDVPPPFSKGFSLGPELRFGDVVDDMERLLAVLGSHLSDPDAYLAEHQEDHRRAQELAYGGLADGAATERYVQRLARHLLSDESSR